MQCLPPDWLARAARSAPVVRWFPKRLARDCAKTPVVVRIQEVPLRGLELLSGCLYTPVTTRGFHCPFQSL